MTRHAVLGPSKASQWLYCTPSIMLESEFPDQGSDYARQGTLAHELAALKVEKHFTLMKPSVYNARLKEIKKSEFYDAEMERHTDSYLQYIRELSYSFPTAPVIRVETKIDLSKYIPEGFGTADCILISGDSLYVVDFKYGVGVGVEAEGNEQMMLYGLGAYEFFNLIYDIKHVHMTIFQPRINMFPTAQILIEDLLEWANNTVKPRALLAWEGKGEFAPSEDTCRWCRAKGACAARANMILSAFQEVQPEAASDPRLLSPERKGEILTLVRGFDKWLKDLEASALTDVLAGKNVTGYKAVEGRSNRYITDEKVAVKRLKDAGYKTSVLYERKLLGLTALEKLVGKNELVELIGEYIEKPQGKPTLVEESDKRPPYEAEKPNVEELFSNL
jgi:hypothetical protein